MHARNIFDMFQMNRLVIKENMRLQDIKQSSLFHSSHKKDLIHLYPHASKCKYHSLVSRRITSRNNCGFQHSLVFGLRLLFRVFQLLKR